MTDGLVKESGRFRSGEVGVFDGDKLLHLGARPQFVSQLIKELFDWAKDSELHPALKGAVTHCEIETIHPFADGNGRMGRLWQTLIMAKWKEVFAWMPMESVIYEKRPRYYDALLKAQRENDSGEFIELTLSAILETLEAQAKRKVEHKVEHKVEPRDKREDERLSVAMIAALKALEAKSLSRQELFDAIGLRNDFRAFKRNIEPLIAAGYVEMTVPEKPSSKSQKYRLTDDGQAAIG
jgi:Fic family protein